MGKPKRTKKRKIWDLLGETEGERRKRRGIAVVSLNAEDWLGTMRKEAERLVLVQGVVTSDDLRAFADEHEFYPHHQNAWGAIFKGKDWVAVDYRKSRYPSNHARRITVWRKRKKHEYEDEGNPV